MDSNLTSSCNPHMPYKNIEDRRRAIREHYYSNKERYIERNRVRRQKLRDYVNDIKDSTPCADCGKSYPYYVMDFDHLRDKKERISSLINSNNRSALIDEMKKCEIVCSNCHRERTFARIEKNG